MMDGSIRFTRRHILLAGLGALAAACAPTAAPPQPSQSARSGTGSTSGQITPIVAASDIAVGTNQRFLFAAIGPDNRPITDASVELAFFKVTGPNTAQLRSRAPAVYRESPGAPDRGVYVARTDFDEAGDWGVAAQITRGGGPPTELRTSFQVKQQSATPALGAAVPASRTLTGTTPAEIERFCSARPADHFHQLSIAGALGQDKPFVVLFASPSFCTSRTCGPSLEVLGALEGQFGSGANYIHVEIYRDGHPGERGEMVPAVAEWGLPSEPWLFVVDANGQLADKFEGSITVDEVGTALARVLA
jgi:hypothetical protein